MGRGSIRIKGMGVDKGGGRSVGRLERVVGGERRRR